MDVAVNIFIYGIRTCVSGSLCNTGASANLYLRRMQAQRTVNFCLAWTFGSACLEIPEHRAYAHVIVGFKFS
jgi:hypothetical protein